MQLQTQSQTLLEIKAELKSLGNPERAKVSQNFFKTGKGEYGEGDTFLGVTVPQTRSLVKKYSSLSLAEISLLLQSKIHEERLLALLILMHQFKKSKKDRLAKRKLFEFYFANSEKVNNWDLVDLSAPNIVGEFLFNEDKSVLRSLAQSKNLWKKRIAIVSTYAFIKRDKFGETLAIADLLLKDQHDLIHKAVGWMLREVGKRNQGVLEIFLKERYKTMPRTLLRYAIEKFPEGKRQAYLKGEI